MDVKKIEYVFVFKSPPNYKLLHFHLCMTNELTILEETKENKNKFHPLQYWISPSLSGKDYKISSYINQIQPGIKKTKIFGESKTLHIGTYDDVLEKINSDIYYITFEVLEDAVLVHHLSHFQISEFFRQCLSLCLKGLCFAASGSYEKDEFINIVEKVSFLGGKFVSINETKKINVFITNTPILQPSIAMIMKNIHIVTSEWIEDCFKSYEKLDFNSYLIKSFNGLVITSSDLEPCLKKLLKEKIKEGGGIWTEVLDSSVTLLIASHFSSTPKIKLSCQLQIPIVSPSWVYAQSENLCSIKPYIMNFWFLNNFEQSILFLGKSFALHVDCEDRNCVIEAVKAHSGTFSTAPDYLIVPHFFQTAIDKKCVTVSWIWACISEKKIIYPDSSILYRPFTYQKASSKLKGFVVVLYKIENEVTRYEISECLRSLGVIVHYKISSMTNVIVANKKDDKMDNIAKKRNIPIVSFSWVIKLINTGKLPSTSNYLIESEKDIAVKVIFKGVKEKKNLSDAFKDQFIFTQDGINGSSILTQESNLNAFSDDENEVQVNSPTIEVTYEPTISKRKKKKYNNDPIFDILSKCEV